MSDSPWWESDKSLNALDRKAHAVFKVIVDRIGERWPEGTMDTVKKDNSTLYEKFQRMEDRVNSLIHMKQKPRELGKRCKEVFNEYERVANCCIAYAQRLSKINAA